MLMQSNLKINVLIFINKTANQVNISSPNHIENLRMILPQVMLKLKVTQTKEPSMYQKTNVFFILFFDNSKEKEFAGTN